METQINISTLLRDGEDIVISGISGRFPESGTMEELEHNLFNKVDMITVNDRRWPTG
jgi:fatty acid synthase